MFLPVGPLYTGLFLRFTIALIVPLLFIFRECEKRSHFYLRFIPITTLLLVASYIQPTITINRVWIFGFFLDFIIVLGIFYFSYQIPIPSLMFYASAAWCVQHIFSTLGSIVDYYGRKAHFSNLFFERPISDIRQFILFCIIIVIFYLIFMQNFSFQHNFVKKGRLRVFSVTIISIASVYVLSTFSITHGGLFNIYILLYDFLLCSLLLYMTFFFNKLNHLEIERLVLKELQKQDSKQQQLHRDSYESIAIRYHDLSKQLAMLELEDNQSNKKEVIKELKQDLETFATLVETENPALDIVLTDKKMFCLKNNIKLFTIVPNHIFDFMNEVDVYTMFSNLLDNAIESVKVESAENRVIKMSVHQKGQLISIDCQNYTSKKIIFKDGMPLTTKDNKEYHGYGTLSICKVAKKYNGSAIYRLNDNIFHAYIMLQSPNEAKSE